MTEAEARKRWCPFARAESDGLSVNRETGSYDKDGNEEVLLYGRWRCIGSQCMAWRFIDKTHYRETELWSRSKNKRVHSAHSDDAWWRPIGEDKEPPEAIGYCGLAGKP